MTLHCKYLGFKQRVSNWVTSLRFSFLCVHYYNWAGEFVTCIWDVSALVYCGSSHCNHHICYHCWLTFVFDAVVLSLLLFLLLLFLTKYTFAESTKQLFAASWLWGVVLDSKQLMGPSVTSVMGGHHFHFYMCLFIKYLLTMN